MLKRYSPKAMIAALEARIPILDRVYMSYANSNNRPVLRKLTDCLSEELKKWVNYLEVINPKKDDLIEQLRVENKMFWSYHCAKKLDLNNGYAQVVTGATAPELYARWEAVNYLGDLLGDR